MSRASMETLLVVIITLIVNYEVCGVVIKAPLSQSDIHGEIRLSQDTPDGDVTVRVALQLTQGDELPGLGWQIRQFPVDYQILNGQSRCSDERLGKVVVDLGERLGLLQLPDNSTAEFIIPGGYLNISGTNGMWGRSVVLHGARQACSTLMVEGEERIAEARFHGTLAGSVLFRWFGAAQGIDAIIFSDIYPVTETTNQISQHNWKIYVTDVLESEADKARDDCNALQIVFDPQNRGTSGNCSPQNPHGCRAGDLDLKLGLLRSGTRHLVRDLGLPELTESSEGSPRILYLAIFDPLHPDSIISCARITRSEPKQALLKLQGGGVRANIHFEQKSPYDLTYITTSNISLLRVDSTDIDSVWQYNIHELPTRGGSIDACKYSGNVYDPMELGEDEAQISGDSQDKYAVGRFKLKHGLLTKINKTWDSFLPLFGAHSIVHRSFLSQISTQQVHISCGTILPTRPYITAQATFQYPVVGRVLFRQISGQPLSDTTILFEYLVYADGNKNDTGDLRWKIHQNPAGGDFYNWTARCLSAGPTFNPYQVLTNDKDSFCHSDRVHRCELGDLSTRHSKILAVGSKQNMIPKTRRLFTDTNLPLSGAGGIVGHSIVIFHENGPKARGERLACTTIAWLNRQKAVVRDWYGNGEEISVRGKIEMIQETEYDLTDVEVNLKGLDENAGYHVHVAPLEIHLSFPCEDSTVYGHWNPYQVIPSQSPSPAEGTPDQYEMGDLSGKFGTLANLSQLSTSYNDSNLDLIGPLGVIGRSVVIHKAITNRRWACSSVERGYAPSEARELRAIASFHHPDGFAYGYVRMTQLIYNDGSASNTAIEVKLRHPGVNDRNVTRNHNWAIFVNPVGQDAAVRVLDTRCVAGGYRWNPHFIQLADPFNDELYREECGPDNPLRCHVGDLSGRLGTIDMGDKRQAFTDINLPLEGTHSAYGKSIIIYNKERRPERYACANIEPDNDIIKYANVRKPPRFEVSKFLNSVRAVMGIPDWMLNIDNRKTKLLHGETCVQILLHFRGPQAHILEQDFSRLMNTGKLSKPSLFIPGALPDPKRPSSLSYRQCGSKDPSEKNRRTNNASASVSVSKFLLTNVVLIIMILATKASS